MTIIMTIDLNITDIIIQMMKKTLILKVLVLRAKAQQDLPFCV